MRHLQQLRYIDTVAREPVQHRGLGKNIIFTGYRGDDYRDVLNLFDYKIFLVPGSDGRYVLAGLGWHQGWNDRINEKFNAEYESNLAHADVPCDLCATPNNENNSPYNRKCVPWLLQWYDW